MRANLRKAGVMTRLSRACVLLSGLLLAACGGASPASPSVAAPVTPTGTTAGTTISIVSSSGNQAFSPSPVAVAIGQTVSFKNTTGNTHHIVADNGAWDGGTVGAGATSAIVNVS